MSVDRQLLSEFIRVTNDKKEKPEQKIQHGTIMTRSGRDYVKMDGADRYTPFRSMVEVAHNDRVLVDVQNHMATIVGNLTDPSASGKKLGALKLEFDSLDLTGVVRFHDLETDGMTEIHGGNIKTGTLSANTIRGGTLEGVYIRVNDGSLISGYNFAGIHVSCAGFVVDSGSSEVEYTCGRYDVMKNQFVGYGGALVSGFTVANSGNASVAGEMFANKFISRYNIGPTVLNASKPIQMPNIDDLSVVSNGESFKIKVNDKLTKLDTLFNNPYLTNDEDFGLGLNLESVIASLISSVKELKEENKLLKEKMEGM